MTPSIKTMEQGTCGCGRSPTGDCIGWHDMSEEQFLMALAKYREDNPNENLKEEL